VCIKTVHAHHLTFIHAHKRTKKTPPNGVGQRYQDSRSFSGLQYFDICHGDSPEPFVQDRGDFTCGFCGGSQTPAGA
jgi:hypothetical protein